MDTESKHCQFPVLFHASAIGTGAGKGPTANPRTHLHPTQKNIFSSMDLSCAYAVSLISRLQWGQIGKIAFIFAPRWTDFRGTAHFPILALYTKPARTEKFREILLIIALLGPSSVE